MSLQGFSAEQASALQVLEMKCVWATVQAAEGAVAPRPLAGFP